MWATGGVRKALGRAGKAGVGTFRLWPWNKCVEPGCLLGASGLLAILGDLDQGDLVIINDQNDLSQDQKERDINEKSNTALPVLFAKAMGCSLYHWYCCFLGIYQWALHFNSL